MDWVYRPSVREQTVFNGGDILGTYDENLYSQSSGVNFGDAHILYDSHNRIATVMRAGGSANFVGIPNAARAGGRGPLMHAVAGSIYVEPSTWAVGNLIAWGWRVGVFEQAPDTGQILLDPDYSMWAVGPGLVPPATWANMQRMNSWERRRHFGFSDNQQFFTLPVFTRVNRRLQDHECLAIYHEGESTSVNVRMQFWLRTLVTPGTGGR